QTLQAALDSAVRQASGESAGADFAAGSASAGSVAGEFATVFAQRAQSVRDLRAAVDGFLGMRPVPPAGAAPTGSPAPPPGQAPLLSATEATNRIAAVGALLTRSDSLYRTVRG